MEEGRLFFMRESQDCKNKTEYSDDNNGERKQITVCNVLHNDPSSLQCSQRDSALCVRANRLPYMWMAPCNSNHIKTSILCKSLRQFCNDNCKKITEKKHSAKNELHPVKRTEK